MELQPIILIFEADVKALKKYKDKFQEGKIDKTRFLAEVDYLIGEFDKLIAEMKGRL